MIACYDEDLNLVDTLTLLGTGLTAAVAHEGIGYFALARGPPGEVHGVGGMAALPMLT